MCRACTRTHHARHARTHPSPPQGSYYVSDSTDAATPNSHSSSCEGLQGPGARAASPATATTDCGWDLTHAPEPGKWMVVAGAADGEPRVRLPPRWQQVGWCVLFVCVYDTFARAHLIEC